MVGQVNGLAADLLDALPLMVIVTRKADGRIVFANTLATAHFDVDEAELADLHSSRFFARPEDRAAAVAALERNGKLEHYEAEVVNRRGDALYMKAFAGQLTHAGEELIVAGFQDITRREAAARRRHSAYRLEAMRRVASTVTHQLSNALVPVITFTELAARKELPQEVLQDYLLRVSAAAERCTELVNEIRDFCRVRPSAVSQFDFSQTVDQARSILAGLLPRQIELTVAHGTEPVPVSTDSRMLEDILLGIGLNISDGIGKKPGWISMSTGRATTACGATMAEVAIEYSNGPLCRGAPSTVSSEMAALDEGAVQGLDMTVAHDLVREMCGSMEILHTARSSTIFLRLPLAPHASEASHIAGGQK